MKEKSNTQKLKLGIFVIAGLVLFIIGVYLIGNQQSMFGSTIRLYASFQNINGLKTGNNVRFSGLTIGTVKSIDMLNDSMLIVGMAIDKSSATHIHKGATAAIGTDGLVGNMIINIIAGKNQTTTVEEGDTLTSFRKLNTDEMLSTLNVTNENAALLTADLLKITRAINAGQGPFATLINDKAAAADISQALQNFRQTSYAALKIMQHTDQLVLSLNDSKGLVGLAKDSTTSNHIRNVAANLDKTSNNLNVAVKDLQLTINEIRNGKGTLNYLVNDTSLAIKVDTTMGKLDMTLDQLHEAGIKLNENLEALKHNFLFRGYFKKLEKEKAKVTGNR
ncbi:MAG TPA: MlaD family protein [Saprospiraceae bacterium]|nr:MlaD family protein [Saprospiraceae bacterium]